MLLEQWPNSVYGGQVRSQGGSVGAVAPQKMPKKKKKGGEREREKENKVVCMREAAAFQPFPK